MEYRQLGRSGMKVPELCFGAGTFGSSNEFFKAWAETTQTEADRMVSLCVDSGLNFFDTADVYSNGDSEKALGKALGHYKREQVLISTKATFRCGTGPNDVGSSRYHLIQSLERSLRNLNTDYIDVYHLHAFDATTPVEETLNTLDKMVREGKVRYIACSNFSGWHLMKSLSVSERYGWSRYVGHQVYYSLVGRDYEWELMPLAADQGVGALVWSPLGWGQADGQDHARDGDSKGEPVEFQDGFGCRAAGAGGVSVHRGRRVEGDGGGDRQDRAAGGAALGVAAAYCVDGDSGGSE